MLTVVVEGHKKRVRVQDLIEENQEQVTEHRFETFCVFFLEQELSQ
jgi:hypothetical protein